MKKYNVITTGKKAVPRSKRLRDAGGYQVSGGTVVTTSGESSSSSGDGHTHANKAALDAISIDDAFYLWLLQKIDGETDSTRKKVKAGDSDKWDGHSFGEYLNQAVKTDSVVQFARVIAAMFKTPNFVPGIETGAGAAIDENGNGEMNGLTLRSFLKVPELIYNRIRVTGGEMWNTEGATIADVTPDPDSSTAFTLLLDIEDGDHVELAVDDICKGHYNSSGGFITSYFRVTAVNDAAKTVRVVLGADSEVPGGVNAAPVPFMNIARYGNFTDLERQRSQYFSSSEQRIVLLGGVDNYIIGLDNYQVVLGNIPDGLVPAYLPISGKPSIYIDNVLARHTFQLDEQDQIIKVIRDRGLWSAATAASDDPYLCNAQYQDDVYHGSCKYRCIVEGTTQEPSYDATDWLLIAGDTTLSLEIESSEGETFLFGHLSTTLTATVKRGVNNITSSILTSDWAWTRETGDVQADAIWNADHASCGRQLALTNEDLVTLSGKFVCTAYVRDSGDVLVEEINF